MVIICTGTNSCAVVIDANGTFYALDEIWTYGDDAVNRAEFEININMISDCFLTLSEISKNL